MYNKVREASSKKQHITNKIVTEPAAAHIIELERSCIVGLGGVVSIPSVRPSVRETLRGGLMLCSALFLVVRVNELYDPSLFPASCGKI